MSFKNTNFLIFIFFIIISFKNINNKPPDLPEKGPNHNNDNFHIEDKDKDKEEDDMNQRDKKNYNPNKIDISDKLREINVLKEKTIDISKKNDESKNKLQKYDLYYYIMVIINIIFSFILISFMLYKIFLYKLHKKKIKSNIIDVSITNNEHKKDNEISISKASFIIKGGNNQPPIENFDNGGTVAPVPIISNQ